MSGADWPLLGGLALAWLCYFALHSALAALCVKRWFAAHCAALMPGYRIAFNTLALLLLVPIGALVVSHRGPLLWAWSGGAAWLANGLALAALGGIGLTLRHYDGAEFLGLRQWASGSKSDGGRVDDEAFHLSPVHRYVRHPWYSLSLVLIWTRDMDAVTLVSALMVSAYFVIGARLEENKLLAYHGAVYRLYRARVGGLLPRPWKTLSAAQAAALEAAGEGRGDRAV